MIHSVAGLIMTCRSMSPHSRGADSARVVAKTTLEKKRARGMPGARCTHSLACKTKINTRVSHHRYAETLQHSPRDGFNGFLRALPGDRALLPPSLTQIAPRKLDASVGASGPHDFAVRIRVARLATPTRPSHPAPNVRGDCAYAPLSGAGRRKLVEVICPTAQAKSFCKED